MTPVPRPTEPGCLIAHRGASATAPENTLAAFRAAASAGARWVEFDVGLLADGTCAVHHDPTLERTTTGTGPISALDRAALAGLDATPLWPGVPAEAPPTLDAALDLFERLSLSANLELKPWAVEDGPALARAVAAALARRPWAPARIVVSSFEGAALDAFRAAAPAQPLALLYGALPDGWRERASDLAAEGVHLDWRKATPADIRAVAAEGLSVRVYTCNTPESLAGWREAGLTGVISDDPARWLAAPGWRDWAGA